MQEDISERDTCATLKNCATHGDFADPFWPDVTQTALRHASSCDHCWKKKPGTASGMRENMLSTSVHASLGILENTRALASRALSASSLCERSVSPGRLSLRGRLRRHLRLPLADKKCEPAKILVCDVVVKAVGRPLGLFTFGRRGRGREKGCGFQMSKW